MRINSLKQAQDDPDIHRQDVQVSLREDTPEQRAADGASAKDQDLERVGILGSEPEGSRKLVMKLVDLLVQLALMQRPMSPIMEKILKDKE